MMKSPPDKKPAGLSQAEIDKRVRMAPQLAEALRAYLSPGSIALGAGSLTREKEEAIRLLSAWDLLP